MLNEVAAQRPADAGPADPLTPVGVEVPDDEPADVVADEVVTDELVPDTLPDPEVVALPDGVVEAVLVTDAGAAVDDEPAEFELPQAASRANGLMRAAAESARRVVFIQVKTTKGSRRLAPV
ncbi:hypothetical protein [Allobranchiibius sp. CTAmp26]|uniref:hypothetical protein n=1 Tax=Allobranchiibius sp. CTAmp26 TaxID=2815214 RepID=UPI001AA1B7E9|nr:hypothetical protein [Allobranchiibius sp. CTAmp26]MBO1755903.1 hypothetical protein [Allobranchiibius sp. CTAmp26]